MERLGATFKIKRIFLEILMVAVTMVYVIPAWMVFINSFKSSKDAFKLGLGIPRDGWHFENFVNVFIEANILRGLLNGIFIAVVTIILGLAISSIASFVIARRNTRVTNTAYGFFIAGIIIPQSIVPVFLLFKIFDLINTYTGIIILFTSLVLPLSMLVYTGFVKTIPRDFDEAAIIDGCGMTRLFFTVIFPLLKPVTATLTVFHFIGIWNDVLHQLFFAQSDKWMLPLTVYKFYGTYSYDWNLIFADVVLTLIPLITIYLIAQKHIISGLTMGAVKG